MLPTLSVALISGVDDVDVDEVWEERRHSFRRSRLFVRAAPRRTWAGEAPSSDDDIFPVGQRSLDLVKDGSGEETAGVTRY